MAVAFGPERSLVFALGGPDDRASASAAASTFCAASASLRNVRRPLIASVAGRRRHQPSCDTTRYASARSIHPAAVCSRLYRSQFPRMGSGAMPAHRVASGIWRYVNWYLVVNVPLQGVVRMRSAYMIKFLVRGSSKSTIRW